MTEWKGGLGTLDREIFCANETKEITTMKTVHVSKMIGLAALSLSLTLLPLTAPASAQEAPNDTTTTPTLNDNDNENEFDLGWLGLLGLIGLAGLAGKKHEEPTRYKDPNVATGTGTEYRR